MIKSADAFPVWRYLKPRIADDDLVRMAIEGLGKNKVSPASLMNNLLFAIPGRTGTVFSLFEVAVCVSNRTSTALLDQAP
jgi:hypothetical protein